MMVLSIKGLEAGYGKHIVLKGIDAFIDEGDLAVIIGPNGSGKSTTVKSVFGLTQIFKGSIEFDDMQLNTMQTHEIVRLGISYVPQGRLVFDTLTVKENLEMGAYDLSSDERAGRMRSVLGIFPLLKGFMGKKANFLSGGQQQQLSIARALMSQPRLLLLDEPSLGLDPKTQKLIFSTIKNINDRGVTVMMIEQNAKQALGICTKAFVIENGKIALQGGSELARKKKVQRLYLGG